MRAVKSLPTSTMSADELYAEVQNLKAEVKAKNNPYVEDVLARAT